MRSLLGTVILYCYCTVVITVTYWTEKKLPSNHRISKNIGWLFSYRTVGFFNTKIPIEAIRIYQFTYWRSGIPNSTWGGNIFPIPALKPTGRSGKTSAIVIAAKMRARRRRKCFPHETGWRENGYAGASVVLLTSVKTFADEKQIC